MPQEISPFLLIFLSLLSFSTIYLVLRYLLTGKRPEDPRENI